MDASPPTLLALTRDRQYPGLRLLLLFGSRAHGEARTGSDWDLGYLASPEFDADPLLADLMTALGSDRVDLVDLGRAGGQLRFRAARDGRVVLEATPGTFARFWLEAVSFWCDVAPIVGPGYEDALARFPR